MFKRKTAVFLALGIVGAAAVAAGVVVFAGGALATAAQGAGPQPAGSEPALTARQPVPILMYHYVDDTPPDVGSDSAALTVSIDRFEAEMDYLAANGYHPVTIAELYASTTGSGRLPPKPVAITFDDGGADQYTVALPVLREHGFRATFFVITGYVGNGACMTWAQLREMQAAGMEIESDTVSHPDLRRLTAERLASELRQSRATLARELGVEGRFLSYPQGRFDGAVIAAARAAGYLAAVRTRSLWGSFASDSCYEWQRINVKPGMSLGAFARAL